MDAAEELSVPLFGLPLPSVLILGKPRRWWSLPLVGQEEDDGCGGGALGAPL